MKIIFPTDPVISADIPSDYPIPPIGEEFYIRFETFIKEPEDLKKVMDLLKKEDLTVEKVEDNKIYLYQGQKADLQGTIESAEYMPSIVQYWQKHPETKPDGF
ncbi:hypothetical protein [Algoriphagus aquimarinus]|uniref:Uncharacterized protein n=1 Tax=Algoriphagus aquimarinus TaxID=237018 RepID=A0A1I1BN55_9BACT|nr:hypothetical protein [Algoriphagus aquimarinus]SFB49890.1 hypothetical protein SAMN04489723_11414 [Algoriphagus aquimarinus]|tara:strand:+ start:2079 stop:2387 length:309 start_codon:yes stop_codon:yes gene_type:complete